MEIDCTAGDGKAWRSVYKDEEEGEFFIDERDETTGLFKGRFLETGKPPVNIIGGCLPPDMLWLQRPAVKPVYFYLGFLESLDPLRVVGDRLRLILLKEGESSERAKNRLLGPGDWVAEKGA